MMMNWSELTQNWAQAFPRVKSRFPQLDEADTLCLKLDRSRFEAYLAEKHQLTLTEAQEEFEDFLFVESLNREIAD